MRLSSDLVQPLPLSALGVDSETSAMPMGGASTAVRRQLSNKAEVGLEDI